MIFSPRSLTFRVVGLSTILAILALIAIATLISTLYQNRAERSFDELLAAHLFNLIGAVGVSEDGVLSGSPNLGDLEFIHPNSGSYWEVVPISTELSGRLRSLSLTMEIEVPSTEEVPFDPNFRRYYNVPGYDGERLRVIETELVLDTEAQIARFRVMGSLTRLNEETRQFTRKVFLYLSIFGVGMIVINAVAILIGLNPLRRIRAALAAVRQGSADRLDGEFPKEIQPLADETNALLENNRNIIDRYRTQVGNLAHSLKTPLAVVTNEARALGSGRGRLIADQAAAMQRQVDHYLHRARIAAQRDTIIYRTPMAEPLARMVRVLEKLNPDKKFSFSVASIAPVFAGEQEDLEEIAGNLLENAAKWAKSRVSVSVSSVGEPGSRLIELIIEDDGPGIPPGKARDAIIRGRRLDETKPGTGLGLAIVADLASEYGGCLDLQRSDLGGLKAVVQLPAAD